jgi:hypothetical protein
MNTLQPIVPTPRATEFCGNLFHWLSENVAMMAHADKAGATSLYYQIMEVLTSTGLGKYPAIELIMLELARLGFSLSESMKMISLPMTVQIDLLNKMIGHEEEDIASSSDEIGELEWLDAMISGAIEEELEDEGNWDYDWPIYAHEWPSQHDQFDDDDNVDMFVEHEPLNGDEEERRLQHHFNMEEMSIADDEDKFTQAYYNYAPHGTDYILDVRPSNKKTRKSKRSIKRPLKPSIVRHLVREREAKSRDLARRSEYFAPTVAQEVEEKMSTVSYSCRHFSDVAEFDKYNIYDGGIWCDFDPWSQNYEESINSLIPTITFSSTWGKHFFVQ